jgi:hypothetical protein
VKNQFRSLLFIAVVIMLLSASFTSAHAVSFDGASSGITLGCSSFTFTTDTTIILDRNNAGGDSESILFEIRDGNGTLLVSRWVLDPIGDTIPITFFESPYSQAPVVNPIVAELYSPAGNGLKKQTLILVVGECPGLPNNLAVSAPSPSVPDGFVLKTITCTTAVFNMPGGQPVGENRITAGQTWYISPEPQSDSSGKSWTEVFVSGYENAWVWSNCVQ